MRRWLVRTGVVLTALLCLGTAGYIGQVWWARKVAATWLPGGQDPLIVYYQTGPMVQQASLAWETPQSRRVCLEWWRLTPWYGKYGDIIKGPLKPRWFPRRTYRDYLALMVGWDLGDDPAAWEAWFRAHLNLVWDKQRKHLVELSPEPTP